jgi:hypothetical protein
VDVQNIPWNLVRPGKLEHSCAELLVDQVIVLELAGRLVHAVAIEQVLNDFRFADIGHRDDFDIIYFPRKVIQVPPNLAQSHNADSDFTITHLAASVSAKLSARSWRYP